MGLALRYASRLGTTTSRATSSARKASHINQLMTVPTVSHGSPTGAFWRIVVGIVNTAAKRSGRAKRCSIAAARVPRGNASIALAFFGVSDRRPPDACSNVLVSLVICAV